MGHFASVDELAEAVDRWCRDNGVEPASGQAAGTLTPRNVRYYRSLGLLDGPAEEGYGEKHRLQLTAIRILQSMGLPLRRIQELLHGRDVADLRRIERDGLRELGAVPKPSLRPFSGTEEWRMYPLGSDFFLVSRTGERISSPTLERLRAALDDGGRAGALGLVRRRED